MTPDQIRDVLRKKFPSGEEIVFKAAKAHESAPEKPFNPDEYLAHSKADHIEFEPLVTVYHPAQDIYYQPDWVDACRWYPAFWPASSLLLTPLIAQTVFLSILVAVLANRRKRART
jgi:hypothetical protein